MYRFRFPEIKTGNITIGFFSFSITNHLATFDEISEDMIAVLGDYGGYLEQEPLPFTDDPEIAIADDKEGD